VTYVWDHYPGGEGQLLLLLALSDWGSDDGTHIFPTVEMMASKTRQSVRAVQYQLRSLESVGWIKREEGKAGRGKAGVYRIPLDAHVQPVAGKRVQILHPNEKGAISGTERVQPDAKKGANGDILLISVIKPLSKPLYISPDFDQAWLSYPKRAGNNPKAAAFKAWQARLKSAVDPCAMRAGVDRYALFCRATDKEGTEYVMMAATFFGPARPFEQEWSPPRPQAAAPPSKTASALMNLERFKNGQTGIQRRDNERASEVAGFITSKHPAG